MHSPTYFESSLLRKSFHATYASLSKIFATSRGPAKSVKLSQLNRAGLAAVKKGACAAAAILDMFARN